MEAQFADEGLEKEQQGVHPWPTHPKVQPLLEQLRADVRERL